MEHPIDATFHKTKSAGRSAFVPFIVAGDPSLDATRALLQELPRRGADLIEVGFPYSDPVADGPTIQAAYTRALDKGIRVHEIFDAVAAVKHRLTAPLVAMVSYSIVYRIGTAAFVARAREAGFAGLIVPDLPADEADELFDVATGAGVKLIQLVTPTTPETRLPQILRRCSGFVYYVSVTGITGERERLAQDIADHVALIRRYTDLPVCVGFGISRPDHVRQLAGIADGVIVGSAIVRRIAESAGQDTASLVEVVGRYVESLARATCG